MRLVAIFALLCAGCTNAPITGLMDHFHPSRPLETGARPGEPPWGGDLPPLAPPVR